MEGIISQLTPARFLLPTARGRDYWEEMPIKKVWQKVYKALSYESTGRTSTEVIKSPVASTTLDQVDLMEL